MFSHLIDSIPDNLQDKARSLIDRVPEGIKRTEDTIDGSSLFRLCPLTTI
jgi:hypothetical protein